MLYAYVKDNRIFRALNAFFASESLILLSALLCMLGNFCSIELVVYTIDWLLMVYLCLFSDRLYPLMALVPFFYITPSHKNNPSLYDASIFYPQNGLIYLGVLAASILGLVVARVAWECGRKTNLQLPKLTWSFAGLAAAYLLSGLGSGGVSLQNTVFSLAEIASICLLYFILSLGVDWSGLPKGYVARLGMILSLTVCNEVLFLYATGNLFLGGEIVIEHIVTGWGIWNNIGGMIIMTMPCAFSLACTQKNGWLYALIGIYSYGIVCLTNSRGAILSGGVVLLLCLIALIWHAKGKMKLVYGSLMLLIAIGAGVICFLARDTLLYFFADILEKGLESSSRLNHYRSGYEQFLEYPLFGGGFYMSDAYRYGTGNDTFIPARWHNTIIQIAASTGFVGLVAYVLHRIRTLELFFRRPALEKTYIGFCVLALLLSSLVDCHFFNIGPGLLYGLLLACAEGLDGIKTTGKTVSLEGRG